MMRLMRSGFSATDRLIAIALACIWMTGGIIGIALGLYSRSWIASVMGMLAVAYGLVWLRAARLGRRVSIQEALWPRTGK